MFRASFYSAFLMLICVSSVIAQGNSADSSPTDAAFQFAIGRYFNSTGRQALIYNGSEYKEYPHSVDESHPFFLSDDWEEGFVVYEGVRYNSIPMLYNISRDELIIEHYKQDGSATKLKLFGPNVQSFSFSNHTFVRLENDSLANLKSGFYDLLYNGNVKVLAKRKKNMREETSSAGVKLIFSEKDKHYIFHLGKYYTIKSKGSFLKVLGDKKKMLSQYARENKLNFKQNKERYMVSLAQAYDAK